MYQLWTRTSLVALAVLGAFVLLDISKQGFGTQPCRRLMEACHEVAAGRHSQPGRRRQLFTGCMGKLLSGKKVKGLEMDEDRIEACKGQMSKNKKESYWESLR